MPNTRQLVKGERLYYLCDTRSVTGNCMMFWRKNGSGYTYNLDDCEVYPESIALRMHHERASDVPYPKDVIDSLSERHIDHQDLDHLLDNQKALLTVTAPGITYANMKLKLQQILNERIIETRSGGQKIDNPWKMVDELRRLARED